MSAPSSGGGGGSKLGQAWGYMILALVLIFSGAIMLFAQQIDRLLGVANAHLGIILAVAAIILIARSVRGGGGDHH